MPCVKCNSDFNVFTWKLKCNECEESHCSKCLLRIDGFFYCHICSVLIRRPPDRVKLMTLRAKEIQNYLAKNNISTHGLVEKQELVELFFKYVIPVRHKKNARKFPVGGSVPNLTARSQAYFNNLKSNAEAAFQNQVRNFGPFGQPVPTGPCRPQASSSNSGFNGPPFNHFQAGPMFMNGSNVTPPAFNPTTSTHSYSDIPRPRAPNAYNNRPNTEYYVYDLQSPSEYNVEVPNSNGHHNQPNPQGAFQSPYYVVDLESSSEYNFEVPNSNAGSPSNTNHNSTNTSSVAASSSSPQNINQNATNSTSASENLFETSLPTVPPRTPKQNQQPKKHVQLSDFKTADELNKLSAKELKELLTLNRVNFKGCVEKAELVERANRLWIDSNTHKPEDPNDTVEEYCKICMDAPLDCVLLECGHIVSCLECGKKLSECPICRQFVIRVVRTFKA